MKNVLLISLIVFDKISFAQNTTSAYSDSKKRFGEGLLKRAAGSSVLKKK